MIFNQGDTIKPWYLPGYQPGTAGWGLRRSDGQWYDMVLKDGTFRASPTDAQKFNALSSSSPLWQDTTGITLPSADDIYQIFFREDGSTTEMVFGYEIKVSNSLLIGTCTTNTDMRGTDGANTVAPDNATIASIAGYLDTEIAAILEDTGTTLPAQIAALNNLSSADVTAAVPTVAEIWAKVIETNGSITGQQALSILLAAQVGVYTAATDVFQDHTGTDNRIDSSSDASGNRGVSVLTPSA